MKFYKQESDGLYYVVEAVPDTESKKLFVKSAYKQKKSGIDQEVRMNKKSLHQTPEAVLDNYATNNSIPQNSDLSTGKTNFNRKEAANQQTADDLETASGKQFVKKSLSDVTGELMRSVGIEGDATEIREELADLYDRARNIVEGAEDDADLKKGKAFVERVAKRIAGNMAHDVDGETREEMAERLRREILSRSAFAEQKITAAELLVQIIK
jgi:hypothetical protein